MNTLRLDYRDHIAVVTLDRPEVLNAMNDEMRDEIRRVCEELDGREDIWVIVFAGSDRAFSAGADVKSPHSEVTSNDFWRKRRRGAEVFPVVSGLTQPTIAAIAGWCLGGGLELALACDLRVSAPTAQLGLTEARLGVIPAGGGTQRLSRLIGPGHAAELLLTGRRIPATRAAEIGLVNSVDEDWLGAALRLADEITLSGPVAVQLIKEALWRGREGSLENALSIEFLAAAVAHSSQDRIEGMQAFLEKRTPNWSAS